MHTLQNSTLEKLDYKLQCEKDLHPKTNFVPTNRLTSPNFAFHPVHQTLLKCCSEMVTENPHIRRYSLTLSILAPKGKYKLFIYGKTNLDICLREFNAMNRTAA